MAERIHPNLKGTPPMFEGAASQPVRPGNFTDGGDFPAIYWGPSQYTQEEGDLYKPPEAWHKNETMKVPKVVRFIYEQAEVDPSAPPDDGGPTDSGCHRCSEFGADSTGSWVEYMTLPTYHAYAVGMPGTKGGEKITDPPPAFTAVGDNRYQLVAYDNFHGEGSGSVNNDYSHVASIPNPPPALQPYTYFLRSDNDPPYTDRYSGTWVVLDTADREFIPPGPGGGFGSFAPKIVCEGDHLTCIQFLEGGDHPFTINFWRRTIRWCSEAQFETTIATFVTTNQNQMQVYLGNYTFNGDEPTDPPMDVMKDAVNFHGPAKDWPEGPLDARWPASVYGFLGLFTSAEIIAWGPPPPTDWIPGYTKAYHCLYFK